MRMLFIVRLLTGASNSSDYIIGARSDGLKSNVIYIVLSISYRAPVIGWLANNELERMWKEAVVA
jgi:hypothetical protein